MKKEKILYFILGLIVASTTAYAAYKYKANEVEYTPENENWKVDNVESAIDDLNKILKPIELELGKTYSMGGYDWVVVEELDGGYVMQSIFMTVGVWPGLKLTTNYEGNISLGNGSHYGKNIDGVNIANYDEKTSSFYEAWKNRELTTASYGKGLYLISKEKYNINSSCNNSGSGNYWSAALLTGETYSGVYGGGTLFTGSVRTDWGGGACFISTRSNPVIASQDNNQASPGLVLPAFNLDASKVYLDGTEIKKK